MSPLPYPMNNALWKGLFEKLSFWIQTNTGLLFLVLQPIRSCKGSARDPATTPWMVRTLCSSFVLTNCSKSPMTFVPHNNQVWVDFGAAWGPRYSNLELWLGRLWQHPGPGARVGLGSQGPGCRGSSGIRALRSQYIREPTCRNWQPAREDGSGLEVYFYGKSRGGLKFGTVVKWESCVWG